MRRIAIGFSSLLFSLGLISQVPLTQIEGRLEVYLPKDTSSIHIGKGAGVNQDLSSDRSNVFVGSNTGRNNTTGQNNSFFGRSSGSSNTIGGFNSFFGRSSGLSNTTGGFNSFFGRSSGNHNTTGSRNVYLGDSTAYRVNGDGNVMIGHFAGKYDETANTTASVNNRLYIHNDATPSPLIYGEFDNRVIHINGEMDIISNSLNLKDLGSGDNHGVIWSEDDNPAFGIIYDGEGSGGDNRLHIRDMISAQEDLVTIKNDGNVGIGIDNPTVTLHIKDIMKLEPISTAPSCSSNNDKGRIYYDSNLDKVRACVGFSGGSRTHGWVNLH